MRIYTYKVMTGCGGTHSSSSSSVLKPKTVGALEIVSPLRIDYNALSNSAISMLMYIAVTYVVISAIKVSGVEGVSNLPMFRDANTAAVAFAVIAPYVMQIFAAYFGYMADDKKPDTQALVLAVVGAGILATNVFDTAFEIFKEKVFHADGLFMPPRTLVSNFAGPMS
tara:strand:+ start:648 stop:1151 length:504 start_codon:yes stop_codon:yes gene_type:complete